jgi:hypothetical protein
MNSVTTKELFVELDSVTDIQQTDPEQNQDGKWVRDVRYYGVPETDTGTAPVVLRVRTIGDTKEAIEVTAPPLSF